MRLSKVVAFTGLTLLSACTSTSVTTSYYKVSGSTEKALDRSIAKNGPLNGHAFAATELQILPVTLEPLEDNRGCYIDRATFRVKANIIYPDWAERKGASADLKRGFDIFARYAVVHEKEHVKIGERAARRMGLALESIAPQRDCDRLLAKVKSTVKSEQARHNREQLAFDEAERIRLRKLFSQLPKKSS